MTDSTAASERPALADEEASILAWASAILRWRKTIIVMGVGGGLLGVATGLLSSRTYTASATFIPQASDGGTSGLALAASQFGLRLPATGGSWGTAVYAELLRSRALLGAVALDTVTVAEQDNRRVAVSDLMEIPGATAAEREEFGLPTMHKVVGVTELRPLGAVRLTVTTEWPSVSHAIATRLVQEVNDFNLKTRKSQAAAERQFVEARANEALELLRQSEARLQQFLQSNRNISGSAQLTFERERIQRDVSLRTQVYTSLLQSLEEAKMREVRDTPVITVIEEPRVPLVGNSRRSAQKGFLGGLMGGVLGVLVAIIGESLAGARRRPTAEAREFFQLLADATPRFLRRGAR